MKTQKIKLFALIALFTLALSSCSSIDETLNSNNSSITQLAKGNPNLTLFVAALEKTDLLNTLDSDGTYTVFAPNNEAFTNFLSENGYASINDVETSVLKQLLLNHVSATEYKATSLPSSGYIKTLGKGAASTTNTLSMYVHIADGIVTLNNDASVIEGLANIEANNGIIHIVDNVIDLPTIVNQVVANPLFDTLQSVVTSTSGAFGNQTEVLSALTLNAAPLTLFAPVNTAFAAETTGSGFLVDATAADVTTVLKYHVTSGNVLSSTLEDNQLISMITMPAQNISIDLFGGAKVVDQSNLKGSIIITDIQCSNGVIHAISRVMKPAL